MKTILIGIAVLLLICLGLYWWGKNEVQEAETDTATTTLHNTLYTNSEYGYSFEYPSEYQLKEYTPLYVGIGMSSEGGFDDLVVASVVEPSESRTAQSYEEFIRNRVALLCAADSPTESITCEDVIAVGTSTANGMTGSILTATLVRETIATGATTTSIFGPVYAYNMQTNVATSIYTALLFYRPITATSALATADLLDSIARSVTISRVER